MNLEKIEIERDVDGNITSISGIKSIKKLLDEYTKEEMPHANEPFHYEAEAAAAFKYFIEWLKRKEKK